jgi:GNAT superfamily N-acetyltransferase
MTDDSEAKPYLGRLQHVRDIDRSETVEAVYGVVDGSLQIVGPGYDIPPTSEGGFLARMGLFADVVWSGGACSYWFDRDSGKLRSLCLIDPPRLDNGAMAQLTLLLVDRRYRRKGLGSRLLAFAISSLPSAVRRLCVASSHSKATIEFYLRHGFRLPAEPIQGMRLVDPANDIVMVKELP